MAWLIGDSGAVIAIVTGNHPVRAFMERASGDGARIGLAAAVIAETTRGSQRDANINRLINEVDVILPVNEEVARQAGVLLARSRRRNATIDALIVASAVMCGDALIVTGGVDDLSALADGYPRVAIRGL